MAAAGVQHKPGMASDMMQELAPLMAADGIDINDPNADFSIDEMNEAMQRAVDRRNLELMTPVGRDRKQALQVLVDFAVALESEGEASARAIMDSIEPEATAVRPAASHVMGAALGLIDSWFGNPAQAEGLRLASIAKWRGKAHRIANDLLVLGRKSRAFDSHTSFIVRHGGELLMHGAALAVAAAIEATASSSKVTPAEAFDLLQQQTDAAPGREAQASAFGPAADRTRGPSELSAAGRALTDEFAAWLRRQAGEFRQEAEDDIDIFTALEGLARTQGFSIHSPEGATRMVSILEEFDDQESAADGLGSLLSYVDFRVSASPNPGVWDAVDEAIETADIGLTGPSSLQAALTEEDRIPAAELNAALQKVKVVAGVPQLLEWLGESRPITSTGGIRRSDIQTVAAMIGIQAEGVAKLPSPSEYGDVFYVQSMWYLSELASWWSALQAVGIIETTVTRVRPGHAVSRQGTLNAGADLGQLCSVFIAATLMEGLGAYGDEEVDAFSAESVRRAIAGLVDVLEGRVAAALDTDVESSFRDAVIDGRVKRKLHVLEQMGLLEENGDDFIVPAALRGTVARGILLASHHLLSADGSWNQFE